MEKLAYSIPELAQEWSVAQNTIRAEIAAGRLATFHIRGCVRISLEEARTYAERCRQAPAGPPPEAAPASQRQRRGGGLANPFANQRVQRGAG
jgi:hypothetical protein